MTVFIRVDVADAGSGDDLSGRTVMDADSGMTARAPENSRCVCYVSMGPEAQTQQFFTSEMKMRVEFPSEISLTC